MRHTYVGCEVGPITKLFTFSTMAPHPDAGTEIKPTMVDVPGGNLEPNEEVSGYILEICDESWT